MARVHPTRGSAVTSGYRTPSRPDHTGTDFRAPTGTPVYAAQSGTVKTGTGHPRAGTWIEIHNNGTLAGYSHLSKRVVTAGQRVNAGDLIGYSGATGNVTGPHLHFYVKTLGVFRDPVKWLNESEVPTTTPAAPSSKFSKTALEYQQRQNRYGKAGLVEDGIDGPKTQAWRAWVKLAQAGLNLWKTERPKLVVDGDYGPLTHARVGEFQRRNKRSVTGVLSNADAKFMRGYGTNVPDRPKV